MGFLAICSLLFGLTYKSWIGEVYWNQIPESSKKIKDSSKNACPARVLPYLSSGDVSFFVSGKGNGVRYLVISPKITNRRYPMFPARIMSINQAFQEIKHFGVKD
jgi:hypothetical protein